MDVKDAIERRKSVRAYSEYEIKKDEINSLIRAVQLAPSAKNLQPCKIVIVRDALVKEKLARACRERMFIAQASAVFCIVVNESVSRWTIVDAAIALEHVALQAVELGLGTCWIGDFEEGMVKEIIKVPEHLKVVALMPIGKPAEEPERRTRKEVSEFVYYEEFGKT
ncbi:MAG: nitroreductase family protein [Candidatus Diapherotrites archaeon]